MAIVRAVAYTGSEQQSRDTLATLTSHPLAAQALMTVPAKATSLEQMSVESINPASG